MEFSSVKPNTIHLDINSCFATIEQQANPNLRNKPLVVVAYDSAYSCILASSVQAKELGIKTGMRLSEARSIYPGIAHLLPDPPKYRDVHKKIKSILDGYSENVVPKSIDEFSFKNSLGDPYKNALEIKKVIKKEVGEYITVSVGISANRYLAKIASNLQKPDGLVEINKENFLEIFEKLKLTDLTGIKFANKKRLNLVGIKTVLDFYESPLWKLKIAFGGIFGFYWYLRLKGYEIDDFKSERKTFGNSFAPPKDIALQKEKILSKLCQKTGFRLRNAGYVARGVHLSVLFRSGFYWHRGMRTKTEILESGDLYREAKKLLDICFRERNGIPRILAVNVFNITSKNNLQLNFFEDLIKKSNFSDAVDNINNKWGDFTIYPARIANMEGIIQDRIAFGK